MGPEASHIVPLCLSFPMCKMGVGSTTNEDQRDDVYENINISSCFSFLNEGGPFWGAGGGLKVSTCQVLQ